ncbi:MAG: hypothetical protein ACM359_00240 [Bacillota bacterium]
MNRPRCCIVLSLAGLLCLAVSAGGYPKPSAYPISWELKFEHSTPKRLVITPKGAQKAQAYWYMTYTVTNLGDQEWRFLPVFELMTEDGKVIRSDNNVPPVALEAIRVREKNRSLESVTEIGGVIRAGEDQARDGVAIWPEPTPDMAMFSIFAGGLSGEGIVLKDDKGQVVTREAKDGKKEPVVLHKTLQMDFHIPGDDRYPGKDEIDVLDEQWVMR